MKMVSKDKYNRTTFSERGSVIISESTFLNNMNLIVAKTDSIAAYDINEWKVSWSIFTKTSISALSQILSQLKGRLREIISSVFTII